METAALIISAVSMVVAIVSFAFSTKSQNLQDRINMIELKLKEYELDEKEKEQHTASCVEVRIIHIIDDRYKIKIWNSGNAMAKNVTASWDETDRILSFDHEKMPFEFLEHQKGFELSISALPFYPRKICIKTAWEDNEGKEFGKEQWCDL